MYPLLYWTNVPDDQGYNTNKSSYIECYYSANHGAITQYYTMYQYPYHTFPALTDQFNQVSQL